MPIYEYRCSDCGHEQEFLQKLSDPPVAACPQCNSAQFAKKLTAAGFQLKGGGWYATDFRNGGSKPAAGKSGSDAGGGSETATKTETKSEAASAAPACGAGACAACTD